MYSKENKCLSWLKSMYVIYLTRVVRHNTICGVASTKTHILYKDLHSMVAFEYIFIGCQIRIDENEIFKDSIFSNRSVETFAIWNRIDRRRSILRVSHRTNSRIRWNSGHGRALECKQFDVTITCILMCKIVLLPSLLSFCYDSLHYCVSSILWRKSWIAKDHCKYYYLFLSLSLSASLRVWILKNDPWLFSRSPVVFRF